jgi:hypothetical protein
MLRAAAGGSVVGEAGVWLVAVETGVGVCDATVAAGGRAGGGAAHAASSNPIKAIVWIGTRIISAHSFYNERTAGAGRSFNERNPQHDD